MKTCLMTVRKGLLYTLAILFSFYALSLWAEEKPDNVHYGEKDYYALETLVKKSQNFELLERLSTIPKEPGFWDNATETEFSGNLRFLHPEKEEGKGLYILREEESGKVYVLNVPEDKSKWASDSDSFYAGLTDMIKNKMIFKVKTVDCKDCQASTQFHFAELIDHPQRPLFNRIFMIAIVAFLFLIMLGMGMTLTLKDFGLVFKNPKGILIGPVLQFGLLPLMAFALAIAGGYDEQYHFIFAGLILIASSPGGVTSNLMTYWAKGDLALSISMTAVATALSVVLTPLLITLYCSFLPDVQFPMKDVFIQILIMVLIPLFLGMLIRGKFAKFAMKTEKFFSALGLIALLFIIVAGILDNYSKFADVDRYGLKFYSIIFTLSLSGMFLSILAAKLLKINNFQTRAIGLETGIRNATLAMTIALLLQDRVGDFHSSLFFTAGLYGLAMYPCGLFMIWFSRRFLPVDKPMAAKPDVQVD